MGFFDGFRVEEGGLNYISPEEKIVLVKDTVPLRVLRVFPGEGQYGPKYTVIIDLEGEERAISFGAEKVPSRDRMFDAMIEYIEREDAEPIVLKLTKVKQAFILKDYNEE